MSSVPKSLADVNFLTEDPAPFYVQQIRDAATSKATLHRALERWRWIASDALEQLEEAPWKEIRWCIEHARSSKHGERVAKSAGRILLPGVMLITTQTSLEFVAPWGCALIRLIEAGRVKKDNGILRLERKHE